MFDITYANQAKKFLKKIDKQTAKRILEKIENLQKDPFPSDINKDFRIEEDLFHLAFSVENMRKTYGEMTKRGVKFTEGGPNDSMTFIEDPDGYEIELIEK